MKLENVLVDPSAASLLEEAKNRFHACSEDETEQRMAELDDLKFCEPEGQWPEEVRGQREAEGRACLTVDRLNPFVHQLVNEFRQNRPQPSVNPVGDGADKETAEILQGMIRHIAYLSDGDVAMDTAFQSMARCGRGFFRVLTEYADDTTFDQNIVIQRIPNLHAVYMDPASTEPDGSDADFGFLVSYIPQHIYKKEYPKSQMAAMADAEWRSIGDDAPEWAERDGSGCVVVEYYRKVRKPVTLYLLEDGTTTKEKPEKYKDTRTAFETQVEWFKLNAIEILDQTIWPGKYIPLIPMLGSELFIDGRKSYSGIIRTAKDAQRAFNYWKSVQAETIALAPKIPWIGPKGFMGSGAQRSSWMASTKRPIAALEYEAYDAQQRPIAPPSRPVVEPPIMAISAAMNGAVDDLKATTGMYNASLGAQEANQSGVAIRSLQRQGMTSNYHFIDNASRSIRHLGRVLIDLIPKIYDTKRVVRIIKPDESVDMVTINGPSGRLDKQGLEKVYDVTVGEYDVTVNVGPGYQTKRQENLVILESLMQSPLGGVLSQVAPDLVASMMDFEMAPQLVERLKKILPPQLQEGNPAAQLPPQVQQQLQQEGQMIEQLTQRVHQLTDLIEKEQIKLSAEQERTQIEAATKIRVAEIQAQTSLLEAQMKTGSPEAINQMASFIQQLQQEHQDLQELVLAMHEGLTGHKPEEELPEVPQTPESPQTPFQAVPAEPGNAFNVPGQPGAGA